MEELSWHEPRPRRVERITNETKVLVEIDLDGTGRAEISTGVGFYDHMLAQLARHGGFDLTVRTEGDLEIDAHHTVEDTALALGAAFARGAGRQGRHPPVRRRAGADGRGAGAGRRRPVRPAVRGARRAGDLAPYIGPVYPTSMTRHILESFGHAARITLHVACCGRPAPGAQPDAHHVVEAQFKAVARALREAVAIDPRTAGAVPSTKGVL